MLLISITQHSRDNILPLHNMKAFSGRTNTLWKAEQIVQSHPDEINRGEIQNFHLLLHILMDIWNLMWARIWIIFFSSFILKHGYLLSRTQYFLRQNKSWIRKQRMQKTFYSQDNNHITKNNKMKQTKKTLNAVPSLFLYVSRNKNCFTFYLSFTTLTQADGKKPREYC